MKMKNFALIGLFLSVFSWGYYIYFSEIKSERIDESKKNLELILSELNTKIEPLKRRTHCDRILTKVDDKLTLREFSGDKIFVEGENYKRLKINKFHIEDIQNIKDFFIGTLVLEVSDTLSTFSDSRKMKIFYKENNGRRKCLTYFQEFYI